MVAEMRMAKKAIGIRVDWQNNNFAHASCLFVHFVHNCDMKRPYFMRPIYGVGEHNTKISYMFH